MTPEQAEKVQVAAAFLAAYYRGDTLALDELLFGEFDETQVDHLTTGLILLANALAGVLAQATGTPPDQILTRLPRQHLPITSAPLTWDFVLGIVADVETPMPAADPNVNPAMVLDTAFNIAHGLTTQLSQMGGRPFDELCSDMAVAAATET